MKIHKILILAISMFYLVACVTSPNMDFKEPNSDKDRTLVLGGEELKAGEPWAFISWKCRDYSYGGKTLVEVGRATFPNEYKNSIEYQELTNEQKQEINKLSSMLGFVLYDGTNTGDLTTYKRDGLTHRWDWGSDGSSYSIVIKTDGTGLYYDFSTAKDGMKSKADDIFKCSR